MDSLVTVGIPTYNRPEGLRKTLDHIILQTYKNIEIVISDNASNDPVVQDIAEYYQAKDSRIKYFRQEENKGPSFNFKFVFEKATGDYFMWAADDDYFESDDLLEKLVTKCRSNILAFPDVNLANNNDISYGIMDSTYRSCQSKSDYLAAWSKSGAGYPIYGLLNIKRLKEAKISFQFEDHMLYYNEGAFLHKIFINGAVQFVPDTFLRIDNNSGRPDIFGLIKFFNLYCIKTFRIYLKKTVENKLHILRNFFRLYRDHFYQLYRRSKEEKGFSKTLGFILNKPILLVFLGSVTVNKIINKAKTFI